MWHICSISSPCRRKRTECAHSGGKEGDRNAEKQKLVKRNAVQTLKQSERKLKAAGS